MSIIYEALKKLEDNNDRNCINTNASKQSLEKPISKGPKRSNKVIIYVLLIVFFICIFFLTAMYLANINRPKHINSIISNDTLTKPIVPLTTPIVEPPKLESQPTSTQPPPQVVATYPLYTLEGIVYDEAAPFAIINGKMLKKADKIDDFQVIDITVKTVELLNLKDNTKLTLSL